MKPTTHICVIDPHYISRKLRYTKGRPQLLLKLILLLQHSRQDLQVICSLVVFENDLLDNVHLDNARVGDLSNEIDHGRRIGHWAKHL